MQKTYKPNLNLWALDTDADHILHKTGSDEYSEIRHIHVHEADIPNWKEITLEAAEAIKAARAAEAAYKSRVVALIRARYDQDDENAILRQRDTKPGEFAAYNAYVEDCKTRVKAEMEAERKDSEETENENSDTITSKPK